MAQKHVLTLRLSSAQHKQLEKLVKKLNLQKTHVIRLALTRLAESEGTLDAPEGAGSPKKS